MNVTLERIIGYVVAAAFFYFAYRLIRRNRDKWLISLSLILAFLAFLCSLTWFQGVFKTHIISVVYSTLEKYGNKLNEFQATTARIQGELNEQQTKNKQQQKQIEEQQKELDSVQGKIRKTQGEVTESQTNILHQYTELFALQGQLTTAQTNLDRQQKKIEDVELLVETLYSKMTSESFDAGDSNRVVVLNHTNNSVLLLAKLKSVPVRGSLQLILTIPNRGQMTVPMSEIPTFKNIVSLLIHNIDLPTGSFTFQYARDTRETNLIQTMEAIEGLAVFDGKKEQQYKFVENR